VRPPGSHGVPRALHLGVLGTISAELDSRNVSLGGTWGFEGATLGLLLSRHQRLMEHSETSFITAATLHGARLKSAFRGDCFPARDRLMV
jgi:hypothetical protein